jgi:hypothetical protein
MMNSWDVPDVEHPSDNFVDETSKLSVQETLSAT